MVEGEKVRGKRQVLLVICGSRKSVSGVNSLDICGMLRWAGVESHRTLKGEMRQTM